MSLGLKLAVMTSQTAPGRHLLSICQSNWAQRNKVLFNPTMYLRKYDKAHKVTFLTDSEGG